jgi:hypothetical protein
MPLCHSGDRGFESRRSRTTGSYPNFLNISRYYHRLFVFPSGSNILVCWQPLLKCHGGSQMVHVVPVASIITISTIWRTSSFLSWRSKLLYTIPAYAIISSAASRLEICVCCFCPSESSVDLILERRSCHSLHRLS